MGFRLRFHNRNPNLLIYTLSLLESGPENLKTVLDFYSYINILGPGQTLSLQDTQVSTRSEYLPELKLELMTPTTTIAILEERNISFSCEMQHDSERTAICGAWLRCAFTTLLIGGAIIVGDATTTCEVTFTQMSISEPAFVKGYKKAKMGFELSAHFATTANTADGDAMLVHVLPAFSTERVAPSVKTVEESISLKSKKGRLV